MSSVSVTRTARAGRTASPPKAESTPPRITRTMATAFTGSSTTRSKAETSEREKRTFTGWPRSAPRSSTSAWHKGFRLRANTVACSANRSFGGAQVSRTFYARGQTGQQLLFGAYQALCAQIAAAQVKMFPRTEMLDLVVVDGHAKGIVVRDMVTGEISQPCRRRSRALHRRLRQCLLPLHERQGLQRDRHLPRLQARRAVRQSLLHADSPDLHPGQRGLSVEAHPDERVAPQRRPRLGSEAQGGLRQAVRHEFPEDAARLLSRAQVSELSAIWRRATFPPAAPRKPATKAAASVRADSAFTLISPMPSSASGENVVRSVTAISSRCTRRSPAKMPTSVPMRIYPAVHYTMGGSWVDYNLMSNVPGLHVLGEANFSDHGANRLGASRTHARSGGRLFRHPLHHRQLSRRRIQ